jgi:hypothetical protein
MEALKIALQVYYEGYGRKINLEKSSVLFGHHCPNQVEECVKMKLGVQSEVLNDFYFGIPSSVGRSPTTTFNFLIYKLWKYSLRLEI